MQLYADCVADSVTFACRLWHSPALLTAVDSGESKERVTVIVPISGETHVRDARGELKLPEDTLVLYRSNELHAIHTQSPTARFVIVTSVARIPLIASELPASGRPVQPPRGARATLVSAVTAMLNHLPSVPEQSQHLQLRAVEHLLAAALRSEHGRAQGAETATGKVLDQALSLIETQSGDATFSVATLIKTLEVSPSTLHRSFEPLGVTPGQHLKNVRLSHAHILLGSGPHTPMRLEAVAARTGFPSVRALREALHIQSIQLPRPT